jgi:hypothetical protein
MPLTDPVQRTEWNVRDADATLIIVEAAGSSASPGTGYAEAVAQRLRKPLLVVDVSAPDAADPAAHWLRAQRAAHGPELALGIGGPRESEAPSIYEHARAFLGALLEPAARSSEVSAKARTCGSSRE